MLRVRRSATRVCYLYARAQCRYASDASIDKLRKYVSKPESLSKPVPAYTRLATKIQDTELETNFSNVKHLEQLRTVYNPLDALGKLEEEIAEEIASALGKTGGKCTVYFSMLRKIQLKYEALPAAHKDKGETARLFNEVRALAREARRDLIIHRQAAGFTFQNHQIVETEFPLPPKLPE